MMLPQFLVIAAIAAWVLWKAYVYYFTIASNPELIQPSLEDVTQDMLHMRKPIVIAERVVDQRDLLKGIFKYEYSFCIESYNDIPRTCTAKYTLVFVKNAHEGFVLIDVLHPPTGRAIRVRLYNDQTLVLPPHWIYRPVQGAVHEWGLYDMLHATMWYCSKLWK